MQNTKLQTRIGTAAYHWCVATKKNCVFVFINMYLSAVFSESRYRMIRTVLRLLGLTLSAMRTKNTYHVRISRTRGFRCNKIYQRKQREHMHVCDKNVKQSNLISCQKKWHWNKLKTTYILYTYTYIYIIQHTCT